MLLEDDLSAAEEIIEYLELDGYTVIHADSMKKFNELLRKHVVDLFLLDRILPDGNGLEEAKALRKKSDVGIILLTGKSGEMDRVIGLEIGADDYITKPYSSHELSARISGVLRRTKGVTYSCNRPAVRQPISTKVKFSDWILDLNSRELADPEGKKVHLTAGEFNLLKAFVHAPQRVLSRDYLLDNVYGRDTDGYDRSIDGFVSRLRSKLVNQGSKSLIKSVRNAGYVFTAKID